MTKILNVSNEKIILVIAPIMAIGVLVCGSYFIFDIQNQTDDRGEITITDSEHYHPSRFYSK